MKRNLALPALLLAFVICFTGCKSGRMDIRGSFKPYEIDAVDSNGAFYGGVYKNEFFGIRGEFSGNWAVREPKVENNPSYVLAGSAFHKYFHVNIVAESWFKNGTVDDFFKEEMAWREKEQGMKLQGDYYREEFNFLGEKAKAIMINTIPRGEKCQTTAAQVCVKYDEYYFILRMFFCNEFGTHEGMQSFIDETFTVLDDSVVGRAK